jgi:hypothetical protein
MIICIFGFKFNVYIYYIYWGFGVLGKGCEIWLRFSNSLEDTVGAVNVQIAVLRIVILAGAGLAWFAAQVYFMPFYSHTTNRLWCGGSCFFCCGSRFNPTFQKS